MARKIRQTSTFSMSFLDIMSCGLGAAILIFLLLKHVTDEPTVDSDPTLLSEIKLLEEEIKVGEENLVRIRNTISLVTDESVKAQGLARKIEEEIKKLKSVLETIAPDSDLDIPGLKNKLAKLEQQKKALENTIPALKVGGDNVLILIDSSASMLDETIVNIVRRRNMRDDLKIQAPKWQRTTAIAQWVVSNLPTSSDFQILSFNDEVAPVLGDDVNQWYEVVDKVSVAKAIQGIGKIVPKNGTNLTKVFEIAMSMTPQPDNIFLITDGLPTLGKKAAKSGSITGAQRYSLFNEASRELQSGIPVNTMLLPLEGDNYAAAAFWRLAIISRGAFVAPASDWP